jgi:hypothetical protein
VALELGLTRRYLYLPSRVGPGAVAGLWARLRPRETVVIDGQERVLSGLPPLKSSVTVMQGVPIRRYASPA